MTPLVLALDTTSEFGSLALARGGEIVEEVALHAPDGFAHVLFDWLDLLLKRHGVDIRQIDCFASAAGPGSFTGVRVGLSAVKGLAEACGRPVVTVSNLQAMAAAGSAALRAPFLDARRGEVYGALYDNQLHNVLAEVVAPLGAWLDSLPEASIEFLCMNQSPSPSGRFAHSLVRIVPRELAGFIARIAARKYVAGAAINPAAADANYIRRSDAELLWKGV